MRYKRIGHTDLNASVVGLGTFEIGGSSWWDEVDDKTSINTIREAMDHGINLIDTAPVYGYGHSEVIVGQAIQGCRDKVIVSSKVGEEYGGYNEGRFHYSHDGRNVYTCLTKGAIFRQIEISLRNLGTDYIDIYSPHFYFDDATIGSVAEAMEALLTLKKQGKIRYVSISNMNLRQLKAFNEANELGICGMQLYCNVLDHDIVKSEMGRYLIANGLSMFGINAMAKGLLAGAFPDDYQVRIGSERSECVWFCDGRIAKVNEMLRSWTALCGKYSASTSAISIAWVLAQPGFTHVITGALAPEHIRANVDGANIVLDPEELAFLTAAADNLKAETIDGEMQKALSKVEKLAAEQTPVIIWGAGVTADYISRRLPIDQCKIVAVVDSNQELRGQQRFGCSVMPLNYVNRLTDDARIVVMIPSDENRLNAILDNIANRKEVIHMGRMKAICK